MFKDTILKAEKLIGFVGASLLIEHIKSSSDVVLIALKNLEVSSVDAIINRILELKNAKQDSCLLDVDIKIPRLLSNNIPEIYKTDLNSAAIRNSSYDKPTITVITENQYVDTLGNIISISATELKEYTSLWVEGFIQEFNLQAVCDKDDNYLQRMIEAIRQSNIVCSLNDLANYCAEVGLSLVNKKVGSLEAALGYAFPVINLPRDEHYFYKISRLNASCNWVKELNFLYKERFNYFSKLDKNGEPLSQEQLEKNFEENQGLFNSNTLPIIKAYIDQKGNEADTSVSVALFNLDWENDNVKVIFEKLKAPKKKLGEEIITFVENNFSDNKAILEDFTKNYKDFFIRLDTSSSISDDLNRTIEQFYSNYKELLKPAPKLLKKLEKIVFKTNEVYDDFYEAFLNSLTGFTSTDDGWKVKINCPKSPKKWLQETSYAEAAFFSTFYKGIVPKLHSCVEWNTDNLEPLFDYVHYFESYKQKANSSGDKLVPCESIAKEALLYKFLMTATNSDANSDETSNNFQWKLDPYNIAMSFEKDLKQLVEDRLLMFSKVSKVVLDKNGKIQFISLEDTKTITSINTDGKGLLCCPLTDEFNISKKLRELLEKADLTIAKEDAIKALEDFEKSYFDALTDLYEKDGLNVKSAVAQSQKYNQLLNLLNFEVFKNNNDYLSFCNLIFKVGVVLVEDDDSIIITPWHPERLKSLALKQSIFVKNCNNILTNKNDNCNGKRKLDYVSTVVYDLNNYLQPELYVSLNQNLEREVLCPSQSVNGYSYLESKKLLSNPSTKAISQSISDFLDEFINLYPNVQDNLNIIFYNCKAVALPLEVIYQIYNQENFANIKLNLTFVDDDLDSANAIYRDLYARLDDVDLNVYKRATSDSFLSNLRIYVKTISEVTLNSAQVTPYDICILYDISSSFSSIIWDKEYKYVNVEDEYSYDSSRVSRKYINPRYVDRSACFLTSPEQTQSGVSFLNNLHSYIENKNVKDELPIKILNINENTKVAEIIKTAHNLADWVVTFDDLIEKKQLENADIKVIRYKKSIKTDKTIIISSKSTLKTLNNIAKQVLNQFSLHLNDEEIDQLIGKIQSECLDISGNIILKASKSYIYVCEMLGLSLSKRLLSDSFALMKKNLGLQEETNCLEAYFMLDDYASWFPSEDNLLSDILGLLAYKKDNKYYCILRILESKFVIEEGDHKEKSYKQIKSSLESFNAAFSGNSWSLNQEQWYRHLADILLDIGSTNNSWPFINEIRKAIMGRNINLSLSGVSFIFEYGRDWGENFDKQEHEIENAMQVIFNKNFITDFFIAYHNNASLLALLPVSDNEIFKDLMLTDNNVENNTSSVKELNNNELATTVKDSDAQVQGSENKGEEKESWIARILKTFSGHKSDTETGQSTENTTVNESSKDDIVKHEENKLEDNVFADLNNQEPNENSVVSNVETENTSEAVSLTDAKYEAYGPHFAKLVDEHYALLQGDENEKELWISEMKEQLVRALRSFHMIPTIKGYQSTPNGVSIELAGNHTITATKILNKKEELLTTFGIRLISAIPNAGVIYVLIVVSDYKRKALPIWKLWKERKFNRNSIGFNSSILVSQRETDGAIIYFNYEDSFERIPQVEPHTIIAGTTGGGKSVLLRTFILDLVATNSPDIAQLILVDPKQVEFSCFEGLPHLYCPVVDNCNQAKDTIRQLVDEMNRRYKIMNENKARSIKDYNNKVSKELRMPYLFLIHDEFGSWIESDDDASLDNENENKTKKVDYLKAIQGDLVALARKSRAAGIYMIFATQRVDASVFSPQIGNCFANRLVLKVANVRTSRLALGIEDSDGDIAATLLGKGHLAVKISSSAIDLSQSPYIDDNDFYDALDAIIADWQ